MIKLSFDGLGKVPAEHGLSQDDLAPWTDGGEIGDLLAQVETRGQGFYKIVDDLDLIKKIKTYAESLAYYQSIVVLGIGGSALGAICINQALGNLFSANRRGQRLFVLDNIDPVLLDELEKQIDLKNTLFLVITKSGGTPETMAQFLYFKKKITDEGLPMANHFVFVTDPEKGLLRKLAKENPTVQSFEVPVDVGGRFSVLSAVGLLPAALMGYDIEKLLEGARAARDRFMSKDFENNQAFQLAVTQFLLYAKGIHMTVTFSYAQKLIKFSDWYCQLLAESIGKALNRAGEPVHIGITPIRAVGATDQHSQNQLYNEGPNDKLFIFMSVTKPAVDLEIPFEAVFETELGYLKGVSFNKLLHTEMEGTIEALQQTGKPCLRLEIEELNEYALGELFMLFEGSIAFLGELFSINAFDQPGVELSKNLTKKMLT